MKHTNKTIAIATIIVAFLATSFAQIVPSTCSYTLQLPSALFAAAGGTNTVNITADSDCSWSATPTVSWITVSDGSGTGSGSFDCVVAANTGTASRVGTIIIQGQTFSTTYTLMQSGATPPVGGSWVQRFGGSGSDSGMALATNVSGEIVAAAYFQGTANFGGGPLTNAGGFDLVLVRYSTGGEHLWSQRFGGTGDEFVKSIAVDASGNIVVVGFFSGTANFGGTNLVSTGGRDIFIAKVSSTGTHVWSTRFGGTSAFNDSANDVALDSSGNVFVTGYFLGGINFGGGMMFSAIGGFDTFLLKLSSAGAHVWSKNFITTSDDFGQKVAIDASGNVLVAGYFSGGGSMNFDGVTTINSAGSSDGYLAKFSTTGTHVWSKGIGGSSGDAVQGMTVDPSGNPIVFGTFNGTVNFGGGALTSFSTAAIFLVKYGSAAGAHVWSKAFNGTGYKSPTDVITDASGNVIITGGFTGSLSLGGNNINAIAPNQAFFTAQYTSGGVLTWQKSAAGTGGAGSASVIIDSSGGAVTIGNFVSTINFDIGSITSNGGLDMFLYRVAP